MPGPAAPPPPTLSLSNCEREPIHIPGLIQEFGVLLCIHEDSLAILQLSANAEHWFARPTSQLLAQGFEALLSPAQVQSLKLFLKANPVEFENPYQISTTTADGSLRLWTGYFHRHEGQLIVELEFEVVPEATVTLGSFYARVQSAISNIQQAQSLQQLCDVTACEVQRISGYDRVMIYRFATDWNGKVVAEKIGPAKGVASYLGHYFPASDIPSQARAIFLANWLRMIPDVAYQPVPIVPLLNPRTVQPLNLTRTFLRSVSPIHLQYLKNMGVGASLTISLVKEGRLWGLISCHHGQARNIPHDARDACTFIGKLVSAQLGLKEEADDFEAKKRLRAVNENLVRFMAQEDDLVVGLVKYLPTLLNLTGGAAAIHFDGKWTLLGRTPNVAQIGRLASWLVQNHVAGHFFHTDSLPSLWPEAGEFKALACGLMAVSIPRAPDNYVLWFKPEVVQVVTWAGEPGKSVERLADGTLKINPRASFESWKETVKNKSLPWPNAELDMAIELRNSIIG